MTSILLTVLAVASLSLPARAASLSKTYSYFSVGGRTLEEIGTELDRKGPRLRGTGGSWKRTAAFQATSAKADRLLVGPEWT